MGPEHFFKEFNNFIQLRSWLIFVMASGETLVVIGIQTSQLLAVVAHNPSYFSISAPGMVIQVRSNVILSVISQTFG